jgi:thioredoxin reductase (NADPH)
VSGEDFAERAYIQALRFGATLLVPATATGLSGRGDEYVLRLDTGGDLAARCVIVATGVTYRQLDAAGLDWFGGDGVYYTPAGSPGSGQPRGSGRDRRRRQLGRPGGDLAR